MQRTAGLPSFPMAAEEGDDGSQTAAPGPVTARDRLRKLVPSTALGLAGLLFCMGLAAAFSGAVLYAYYESRQEQTTNQVNSFVGGFSDQLDNARKIIQTEGDSARDQIKAQLDELQKFAASGTTLSSLLNNAQPSVYFVSTLDTSGGPSVGSAFVVFSDAGTSYLLTSYATVAAATAKPGPTITLKKAGADDLTATLYTWDQARDLALLTVPDGNLKALPWAAADAAPKIGDRLFAISGLGANGASITQGFVADVSADGMQHDVPVGPQTQGGPLLDSNGNVVGVASRAYSPTGFTPDEVWFAPMIRAACTTVLSCPEGATPSPAAPN